MGATGEAGRGDPEVEETREGSSESNDAVVSILAVVVVENGVMCCDGLDCLYLPIDLRIDTW